MRKHQVPSFRMFDEVDVTSNQTSNITNVQNLDVASIHVSWSGVAIDGILTVEARNGKEENWFELDMGGTIAISGVSGDHELLFRELPHTDIRLQYVNSTSTSGTLSAVITMKTVGA